MATRLEQLQRIRTLLGSPMPSRPDFATLFQLELSCEADILNTTTNAERPWAVNTTTLQWTGTNPIELTVTDMAKPILLTRIITDNPYISRLPVPFQDLTHQLYGTVWNNWNGLYGWAWNWSETPERATFYRVGQSNQTYCIDFQPEPQSSAEYELTYAPMFQGELDPLENTIQLPEMASLVQLRVATAALPYCAWYEDEAQNVGRRRELAQSFAYQLSVKEPLFSRYVSSIVTPRDVDIDSWSGAFS